VPTYSVSAYVENCGYNTIPHQTSVNYKKSARFTCGYLIFFVCFGTSGYAVDLATDYENVTHSEPASHHTAQDLLGR